MPPRRQPRMPNTFGDGLVPHLSGDRAQNKLCNFFAAHLVSRFFHELKAPPGVELLALPNPLRCASGPLPRAACIDYCACGHNACRAVCAPASRACVNSSVGRESKLATETKTRSHTHCNMQPHPSRSPFTHTPMQSDTIPPPLPLCRGAQPRPHPLKCHLPPVCVCV
jgi:hypothetical protein